MGGLIDSAINIGSFGLIDSDVSGTQATQRAIDAQSGAARDANATQRYMYDQQREDLRPWINAGTNALSQLTTGMKGDLNRSFTMSDFTKDPGYDFRMSEGLKAIDRSAAARGGLNSGATLKALNRFGQDFASNEYANVYNRFNNDRDSRFNKLSSLAGLGQVANNQIGQATQNYGNAVSSNQIGLGNAIASGEIGTANRNNQLLSQGMGIGAAALFSDERLKTDIKPVSREDLQELKDSVRAYSYKYKDQSHGVGEFVGIMAQELEKTKLGKGLVEMVDGKRVINIQKTVSLMLASLAGA